MEDYKKKYEETIERIKEMYLSQPGNCEFTAPFEKAFPEAKEWEEEKTKADILRFINSHLAGFPDCKRFSDWVDKHSEEKSIDTVKALCENQGSSWTAEDNVMYDKCLMALSNWRDSVKSFGKDAKHCQEIIDWLRSKINGC
jgi:hypothetical protein